MAEQGVGMTDKKRKSKSSIRVTMTAEEHELFSLASSELGLVLSNFLRLAVRLHLKAWVYGDFPPHYLPNIHDKLVKEYNLPLTVAEQQYIGQNVPKDVFTPKMGRYSPAIRTVALKMTLSIPDRTDELKSALARFEAAKAGGIKPVQ